MKQLKWDPYVIVHNEEILDFWSNFLQKQKNVLFIQGIGFDPRMNSFARRIKSLLSKEIEFLLLDFEGPSNYTNLTVENMDNLLQTLQDQNVRYSKLVMPMWEDHGARKKMVGPRKIVQGVKNGLLNKYKHIVIDISSMPRAIYFTLISIVLDESIRRNKIKDTMNVFINVVENPELDEAIKSGGNDKAEFIPNLGGGFTLEADLMGDWGSERSKIWIPILGEGQKFKMEKIYTEVSPDEICPVLPFPSKNPIRTDGLLKYYREMLFDTWLVEIENLIYASESNPFELYRNLVKTIERYMNALSPIGGCKVAISSMSSKLLSVGAFLSVYEMYRIRREPVGLIHAGGSEYDLNLEAINNYNSKSELINSLWIDGEPYN